METITLTRQEIKDAFKMWFNDMKENPDNFDDCDGWKKSEAEEYANDTTNEFFKYVDLVKRA